MSARTAPEQVRVVKFASVPPIVCTKWCRYAGGHPCEHHVDDQSCVSEERYVRPAVRATGGWKDFQTFVVHARRQSATSRADVVFWEQSADCEQRLTVAEARALAANLLAAADLAEASTAMVR